MSKESIVLDLVCELLGESRFNRTPDEYVAMAAHIPKLESLYAHVNERLKLLDQRGIAPYQICHFKAGDGYTWYEDFPTSISKSTVRTALVSSGFWQLMKHRRKHLS